MSKSYLFKPFNWREINAKNYDEKPKDALCRRYRNFLEGVKDDDEEILLVRKLRINHHYKNQLEAMLLAGLSMKDCASKFGLPINIIKLYKQLFFDIDNKHSEVEFSDAALNDPSAEGSRLKICARRYGKEALLHCLGYRIPIPTKVIKELSDKVSFSLLTRCAEIELVNPNNIDACKLILKTIETYIKFEAAKEGNINTEVQEIFKQLNKLAEAGTNLKYRNYKDL